MHSFPDSYDCGQVTEPVIAPKSIRDDHVLCGVMRVKCL